MLSPVPHSRRLGAALVCAALLTGPVAGCGLLENGGGQQSGAEVSRHTHGSDTMHASLPVGDGTRNYEVGYTLADVRPPEFAGEPGELRFRIENVDGAPQTDFIVEQTKSMHVYVVREDLSVFRHIHPELAEDGRWSTPLTLPEPGDYRVVTEFVARDEGGNGDHVILGETVTVDDPTAVDDAALATEPGEPAADRTAVDVTLEGETRVGEDGQLTAIVTDMQGQPVQLDTYLGTYAHLTAFHVETGALVHMHPLGRPEIDDDGARLDFHSAFVEPGDYRLFVQVRVDGYLHTIPVDTTVS